ncbi:MAG: hypothetical protein IJE14_05865 [Clostridia bacterium]|nr:hypothetical protein [Clostridia bacterium]
MREIRINYINITGEEFRDKLLKNSDYGKCLCYSAATEKDALLPFPEAIENISKEPCRTYLEVKVSSETHERIREITNFFIHCVDVRCCFGCAELGPTEEITLYICY